VGVFARALAGSLVGKIIAGLFVAVCIALGFGPEKWAAFMIAELPLWITPTVARFAFVFLAVAAAYFLFRSRNTSISAASENVAVAHIRGQAIGIVSASADHTRAQDIHENGGRIFVSDSITPEYFRSLYAEHTAAQADKLVEVYIGKWMRVSGTVQQVYVDKGSHTPFAQIIFSGAEATNLIFSQPWIDRVSGLRRSDKVDAVGKIKFGITGLMLENCELV